MTDNFTIDCTGDVVAGDTIRFTEAVFGGAYSRYRRAKFLGDRTVEAEVVRDSYGGGRQQHTFTLRVIRSEGYDPLATGSQVCRKGRNVYRNGTVRRPWPDEAARHAAADEKHTRGDHARATREARQQEQWT